MDNDGKSDDGGGPGDREVTFEYDYWSKELAKSRKYFKDYNTTCDMIDQIYSNSKNSGYGADSHYNMFWANMSVVKASIYSRPPIPVVEARFKDRTEVINVTSEILERALSSSFELESIDDALRLVRDDLSINARGNIWLRYEDKYGEPYELAEDNGEEESGEVEEKEEGEEDEDEGIEEKKKDLYQDFVSECVKYDHVDRHDFLHQPAKNWKDVDWVARRFYYTREEAEEIYGEDAALLEYSYRYKIHSDNVADNGPTHSKKKTAIWQIWNRCNKEVIEISEDAKDFIVIKDPPINVDGFFPCPRPAYATLIRNSLIPQPDHQYYKNQLREIDEYTRRISNLTESIKMKGFYPHGAADLSTSVETALRDSSDRVLVGVANWAVMGGSSLKDSIVWLPIDMVVQTISALRDVRAQAIDEVYQISGLSDIMRGETVASETLGAQQLKSQYGSIRIREKQSEMVRIARDAARIAGEIIAENFSMQTIMEMSRMNNIPSQQDLMGQGNMQPPQNGEAPVTVEQIEELLRSQKVRPFVLDIETDSTIQPDEDSEKKRRSEFLTSLAGVMTQLFPMVQQQPETAPFAAEVIKFAIAPFRAGRTLNASIDKFTEDMKATAQNAANTPKPNPDAIKAEAEAAKSKGEMEIKTAELKMKQEEHDIKLKEMKLALDDFNRTSAMRVLDLAKNARSRINGVGTGEEAMDNGRMYDATAIMIAEISDKILQQTQVMIASNMQLSESINKVLTLMVAPKQTRLALDEMSNPIGSITEIVPDNGQQNLS